MQSLMVWEGFSVDFIMIYVGTRLSEAISLYPPTIMKYLFELNEIIIS